MKSSWEKVQDFLHAHECTSEVKTLQDSTRSALDAAKAIGCDIAQVAKSLVFFEKKTQAPILFIVSGRNQVAVASVEGKTNLLLEKPEAKWVKEVTGFAIGGIPPFAHAKKLKTFIDSDLLQHDIVWAAAGTPFSVFAIKSKDLLSLSQAEILEVT
jgi:prolyl-tRNA editing enzyme YbaK/EbsC (Cys-tRNA(Pro) deacylase)